MSRLHTSFVLGYHGCDKTTAERAVAGEIDLIQSDSGYDWLGPGVYFWESDPLRAHEWAKAKAAKKPGLVPYVIGAAIDLGNCLDLTVRENIESLRQAHEGLVKALDAQGKPVPQNKELMRNLDCAVIKYLHDSIDQSSPAGGLEPFDTVRGLFQEGKRVYPDSGFFARTHTQIAVRSAKCIKGVFVPRG